MIRLIMNEVIKLFHQKKVYIFFAVILVISLFNLLGTISTRGYLSGYNYGQSFPLIIFDGVSNIIFPMFVVVIIAGLFSDEFSDGSLKLPLLRKINRNELLLAKMGALGVMILIFLFVTMILGYVFGILFFGWGQDFVLKSKSFEVYEGILLTLFTYGISLISYMSFGMIILFLAVTIINSASVVVVGTGILFALHFSDYFYPKATPYLITSYFNTYRLLALEFDIINLIIGFLVIITYGVVFYAASIGIFKKKDLLI